METWEVLRMLIEAVGDEELADAVGYERSYLHRQARPTPDVGDPDATGKKNMLDRFRGLVEASSGTPEAEVLRLWTAGLFSRALDGREPEPLTREGLLRHVSEATARFGRLLAATENEEDRLELVRAAAELMEWLAGLIYAAQAAPRPRPRLVEERPLLPISTKTPPAVRAAEGATQRGHRPHHFVIPTLGE